MIKKILKLFSQINSENSTSGYLYVICGEKHLKEAIISAHTLKTYNSNANITLIINESFSSLDLSIFDNVIIKQKKVNGHKEAILYRVENLYFNSPYKKTFFIDSDTYFLDNCEELFNLLDHFDVLMAQAPKDNTTIRYHDSFVKGYFPYNCGIMVYRKSRNNNFLFKRWINVYEQRIQTYPQDQAAFCEAWLDSNSKIYVLSYI